MVSVLVWIVVVAVVAGLLAYLVQSAPFIVEPIKSMAVWAICGVAIVIIVLKLAGLADVG